MGIEPTGETVIATPNGFEDRGRHQACKHFQRDESQSTKGRVRPSLFIKPIPFLFAS